MVPAERGKFPAAQSLFLAGTEINGNVIFNADFAICCVHNFKDQKLLAFFLFEQYEKSSANGSTKEILCYYRYF